VLHLKLKLSQAPRKAVMKGDNMKKVTKKKAVKKAAPKKAKGY
jgi:hypothetical protein